jgi:hypothetical protein
MAKIKKSKLSLSAIEDCWQLEATRVAIEQARAVVAGGAVPPLTPIGRLSDTEWGWVVAAVLFGWISTRSRQATSNGVGPDKYLYVNEMLSPDPWDAGAIEAILPELGNCQADWSKSLSQFSREEMITFLGDAYDLIGKATRWCSLDIGAVGLFDPGLGPGIDDFAGQTMIEINGNERCIE